MSSLRAMGPRLQTWLLARYDRVVLAASVAFMLWVRLRNISAWLTPRGVLFAGTDAWYHRRHVHYVVHHFPDVLQTDPLTNYPHGVTPGQFGTLFDALVALVALIVGLGNPSPRTIDLVLAITPAVAGALTVLPVFYLTRRIADRFAASVAVTCLALLPGTFLSRTLVAVSDHNSLEPLLLTTSLLALAIAHQHATSWRPRYAAILAVTAYLLVWPPGVLLIGIYGLYVLLQYATDLYAGRSPHGTQQTAVTITLALAVLLAVRTETLASWSPSDYSRLQPVATGIVAVGAVIMGLVARQLQTRRPSHGRTALRDYVTLCLLLGVLAATTAYALAPHVLTDLIATLRRFVLFGSTASSGIGEALPYPVVADAYGVHPVVLFVFEYGLLGPAALLAVTIPLLPEGVVARLVGPRRPAAGPGLRLVAVAACVLAAAAWTQVRFQYYLGPLLAILAGVSAAYARHAATHLLPQRDQPVSGDAVLAVLLALGVLLVPLAAPVTAATSSGVVASPVAPVVAGNHAPSDQLDAYQDHLNWLESATPQPGTPPDYGVIAWWDAGHWITTIADRPAVANPMQDHRPFVASILTARSESRALHRLDDHPGRERYIIVDHTDVQPDRGLRDMARSAGVAYRQYTAGPAGGRVTLGAYHDALAVRLYHHHGSRSRHAPALEHFRLIGVSEDRAPNGAAAVKTFERVPGATLTGQADPNATVTVRLELTTRWDTRFEYVQQVQAGPDGRFRVTVPYATVESQSASMTEQGVRSTSSYTVSTAGETWTVQVSETAVVDGTRVKIGDGEPAESEERVVPDQEECNQEGQQRCENPPERRPRLLL